MTDPQTKTKQAANQHLSSLLLPVLGSSYKFSSVPFILLKRKSFCKDTAVHRGSWRVRRHGKVFSSTYAISSSYWGVSFVIYGHLTWEFYRVFERQRLLSPSLIATVPYLTVSVIIKATCGNWSILWRLQNTYILSSGLFWGGSFIRCVLLCLKLRVFNTITPPKFFSL